MTIDPISHAILTGGHSLVAGATGSGKSTLLTNFLFHLTQQPPQNYKYIIVDLKMISLRKWEGTKHCLYYADSPEKAQYIIKSVIATMHERLGGMLSQGIDLYNGTRLFLIIDEAADLLDTCPRIKPDIIHLMRLGRATGIFIVYATQDPSKKTIAAQIQQNCTNLIALRCRDKIASRQIIGSPGAEMLPRYGKALFYTPDNMKIKIADTPKIDDEKIKSIIDQDQKAQQEQKKTLLKKIFNAR